MIVMKFGGSSVGTADAIGRTADIISGQSDRRPVVVVSALQGVTDCLINLAETAAKGRSKEVSDGLAEIRKRHDLVIGELSGRSLARASPADEAEDCRAEVSGLLGRLEEALSGIGSLRELSDRSMDLIMSFGERMSAPIVAQAVRQRGRPAIALETSQFIETDRRFGQAAVDFCQTSRKASGSVLPFIDSGVAVIATGFIGATPEGAVTTLGRGGSDYSAAVLANVLEAEELVFWKEVDGVMTADPGVVAEARLLPSISYDEAAEMSFFGAKVLHSRTMVPLVGKGIPTRIRNTFRPEGAGTAIVDSSPSGPQGVKVVTAMPGLSSVTVEGKGMIGIAGFAARVLDIAGRLGINILMFSQASSEQNICLITGQKDGRAFRQALERTLRQEIGSGAVEGIGLREGLAVVAVVGDGMRGRPGVAARAFRATELAGASVLAIAQGTSERNISFVIEEGDVGRTIALLHQTFELESVTE